MRKPITLITYVFLCIFILGLVNGCGPQKVNTTPGAAKAKAKLPDFIFYPPLPNAPKYQYLTTFSNSTDVRQKKSKFFKFVAGDEQEKPKTVRKPYGVAIHDGVIYACDVSGGSVAAFDMKRQDFRYLGIKGSGKLAKPVNISIDKENSLIYVADIGRKQVLCFNPEGDLLKSYGKEEQFNPSGVAHYGSKLFICDVRQHKVFVMEKTTGQLLYTFGKAGSKEGELFHPTNLFIRDNRIYISDTNNFRVQVFDLNGKFLSTFGKIGRRPGDFSRGKGIAVDADGRIYVVDSAFENVQVFARDFRLLLFMLGPGREKHNINLPAGIAIDYDNIGYFKKYLSPKFEPEYLLLVSSNFGRNKVNVYAYGKYRN